MGLNKAIGLSGLFPEITPDATLTPDEVFDHIRLGNHPSFLQSAGGGAQTGLDVVSDHLQAGFGLLFTDLAAAERYVEGKVTPAPLGCIVKDKADGTTKVRVIMDLRRNKVNDATQVPERQVLPTIQHHALDLLKLSHDLETDDDLTTLVLDFRDAFMGIPLAFEEQGFNACYLENPITRKRPPAIPDEALEGQIVLWRVLGFGGKPNPLVYSRAASFASRTGQALLRPSRRCPCGSSRAAPGRLQLYVDDPVLTLAGTSAEADLAIDLVLLWWLCLGPPLAWRKGSCGTAAHRWIGGIFDVRLTAAAPEAVQALVGDA